MIPSSLVYLRKRKTQVVQFGIWYIPLRGSEEIGVRIRLKWVTPCSFCWALLFCCLMPSCSICISWNGINMQSKSLFSICKSTIPLKKSFSFALHADMMTQFSIAELNDIFTFVCMFRGIHYISNNLTINSKIEKQEQKNW